MDPSAPQTVLKGVAVISSVCGVTAGLYGGFKHGASRKFLLYSAVNSGIVAATFFSIREYVVSPVLVSTLPGKQYQLRRQRFSHRVANPISTSEELDCLSWGDIRASRLLDSGISGGFSGGILNAWKRGRRGVAPGLITGALTCALLQWCCNEFNAFRIRYVYANSAAPSQRMVYGPVDVQSSLEKHSPHAEMQRTSVEPNSRSIMDCILSILGRRISDENYLKRLERERDSYLRRISELEDKKQ